MTTIEEKAKDYAASRISDVIDAYQSASHMEFLALIAELYLAGAKEAQQYANKNKKRI